MAKKKGKNRQLAGEDAVVVEGEILGSSGGSNGGGNGGRNGFPGGSPKLSLSLFRQRLPWILVGLLSIFIGGAIAAPWMEQGLRKIAPTWFPPEQIEQASAGARASLEEVAALDTRIVQLEAQLSVLQTDLATARNSGSGTSEALSALGGRLSALEQASHDLGEPVTAAAQSPAYDARLADLEARLDQLGTVDLASPQSLQLSQMAPHDGIALALARLMRTVDLGRPYRAEFLELTARAPALAPNLAPVGRLEVRDALAVIEPFAAAGIPTLSDIEDEFEGLVSASYKASLAPAEDASWWQRLWAGARDSVVIRKTGDAEGDSVEAILGRAEARMSEGKLAATISEIEALSEAAGAIFADWLSAATARRDAAAALETIDSALSSPPVVNPETINR